MKLIQKLVFLTVIASFTHGVIALESMIGATVNWVGIASVGGYKIEAEIEKNGIKKSTTQT